MSNRSSTSTNPMLESSVSGCPHAERVDGVQHLGNSKAAPAFDAASTQDQHMPLQFVTTLLPPSLSRGNQEVSKIIRSHAMRSYIREKTLTSNPPITNHDDTTPKSDPGSTHKFKLSTWTRKGSNKKIQQSQQVTDSSKTNQYRMKETVPVELGAINIFPIELRSDTKRLIYHYHHNFTQNSAAVNPEGSWYAFAITDAALLHATLCLVSLHYDLSYGLPVSNTAFYHQGKAIKLLKERLQLPDFLEMDTVVGTIAILANCETMNGRVEAAGIHMQGLVNMVKLRGGINAFRGNQVLQRVLAWADFCYASTWSHDLVFPAISQASSLDPFSRTIGVDSLFVPSHPATLEVLNMLRTLSNLIEAPAMVGSDPYTLSTHIYLAEYRISSLKINGNGYSGNTESQLGAFDSLFEAFCFASHLYLHLAIRELPGRAKMHHGMVRRLRRALESVFRSSDLHTSQPCLPLVLWILFIGTAAASENSPRSFFLTGLLRASRVMGIQSETELEQSLKKVAWLKRFCDEHCSILWELVKNL